MEELNWDVEMLETDEGCNGYQFGHSIGKRFSQVIKSRVANDQLLNSQLRPFSDTTLGKHLIQQLSYNNRLKYPRYWDELIGTADGSGVPLIDITLLNFRKEIVPFIQLTSTEEEEEEAEREKCSDCSDVLVLRDSIAVVAHNEDAAPIIANHVYMVKTTLPGGLSFTAYTYAGELPTCAFGFNSHGVAFTLDSVPPAKEEIVPGGIARNFVSRDLLESSSLEDALMRIREPKFSVGHCYNLVDINCRRILTVEAASRNRVSVYEVGPEPCFHANMYLHLPIKQVHDENSIRRQTRAAELPKENKEDILKLLGDSKDEIYPIYMDGPQLKTICTIMIDLDEKMVSFMEGNPKNHKVCHAFSIS